MANRPRFSRKERARLFSLNEGTCYLCSGKIGAAEAWHIEHVVPWELTRDNSDGNIRLAHVKCHKPKTAGDIRAIRKADRIKAKHNGYWPRTSRPLRSRNDFNRRQSNAR